MSSRRAVLAAATCGAAGAVLVLITIARTSITQDEPSFYSYGERILTHGRFDRELLNDDSKLPAAVLYALPGGLATAMGIRADGLRAPLSRWFEPSEASYIAKHFPAYLARLMTVAFYLGLCGLVFAWAAEIYGVHTARAATALTAFLPALLGHAGVATADLPATCAIFAAVYTMARCFLDPSPQRVVLAGVAVGLSQLVKYTAVDVLPIAVCMVVARVCTALPTESRSRVLVASITSLAGALAIAVIVINLGFLGQRVGVRVTDLPCESAACRSTRAWIGGVPLPLPYEYLNGLDLVRLHDEESIGVGQAYLLGELRRDGFPTYYLVATLLKTPVPFLLLVLIRPWRRQRRYTDAVLIIAIVGLFVHVSFFLRSQLGIRFFLPAFPFLALLAAANLDAQRSRRVRIVASALLGLQIVATVAACPHYLAYFNVAIGSPRNAYRYLADSNLDWAQDRFALWAWERAHSGEAYALAPRVPTTGRVIVRANDFVGIDAPEMYDWLRARGVLIDVIGDSYLLFDVPDPAAGEARNPS